MENPTPPTPHAPELPAVPDVRELSTRTLPPAPMNPHPAMLSFVRGILDTHLPPETRSDPRSAVAAQMLQTLARALMPTMAAQVAATPPSVVRDLLIGVAYSAVGELGYTIRDAAGEEVLNPSQGAGVGDVLLTILGSQ